MSETLLETANYIDNQSFESDDFDEPTKTDAVNPAVAVSDKPNHSPETTIDRETDRQWGDYLTNTVAANVDTIVRCSWMDGDEVTVPRAMSAFLSGRTWTAEDEPYLNEVIDNLLECEVVLKKEKEEEEEIEEPVEAEEVEPEEIVKIEKVKPEPKSKPKKAADNKTEPPIPQVIQIHQITSTTNLTNRETGMNYRQKSAKSPKIKSAVTNPPEVMAVDDPVLVEPAPVVAAIDSVETVGPAGQKLPADFEQPEFVTTKPSAGESYQPEPISNDELDVESLDLVEELDVLVQDRPINLRDELVEPADNQSAQQGPITLYDTLTARIAEITASQSPDEPPTNQEPEEIPLYELKQVDQPIAVLVEVLDVCEPDKIEIVSQIINMIPEVQTQVELEGLFFKLLYELDMDYNPELVESLAQLSLWWSLSSDDERRLLGAKISGRTQTNGTGQVAKARQARLGMLEEDTVRVYEIGRFALERYSSELIAA